MIHTTTTNRCKDGYRLIQVTARDRHTRWTVDECLRSIRKGHLRVNQRLAELILNEVCPFEPMCEAFYSKGGKLRAVVAEFGYPSEYDHNYQSWRDAVLGEAERYAPHLGKERVDGVTLHLRRLAENAPADPGPIAEGLVGWSDAQIGNSHFVCAVCSGRIMARGCHLPDHFKPQWEDDQPTTAPVLKCCVCDSRKGTVAAV